MRREAKCFHAHIIEYDAFRNSNYAAVKSFVCIRVSLSLCVGRYVRVYVCVFMP